MGYGPFLGYRDDTDELRRPPAGLVGDNRQLPVDLHGIDGQRGNVVALHFREPFGQVVGKVALAAGRRPANYECALSQIMWQLTALETGSSRWLARVEHVRPRRLYSGLHVVPRGEVCLYVNSVTAPGLPDSLAVLRASVTDVDLLHTPGFALVPRECVLFDLPQYFEEAPLDDRIRDAIWQRGGLRAPPGRELEDVGRVESAVRDEPECLLVVLLGLTGMSHDYVGAERALGGGFPENLDLAPVPLRFVPTVHHPEHPVRTRLHGQVEALYYGLFLPDGPQCAVLHVGRMARRKPHARRLLRDGLEKVAESLALMSPRVHRLAQERYVSRAAGDEVLNLPEHALHGAADHTPPHRRDYAVTTLVVAPCHYGDEGVVSALRARQLRRVRLLHGGKAHELGQLVGIMGAQDKVYVVGLPKRRRLFGGADTARESHLFDPSFAAETVQLPEVSFHPVDGVLADVAGIEYHEVGVLVALHFRVSGVLDHAPYPVRVVHVHLAPEGPYARGLGLWTGPLGRLYGERYGRRLCRATHTLPPARRRGL